MALAMPPPDSPTGTGSFVKKFTVKYRVPFQNRYPRMMNRIPTTKTVHAPVRLSITAFTILRRRVSISFAHSGARSQDQHTSQSIDNNCDSEENQPQLNQRTNVDVASGLIELVGNHRRNRVPG